MTTDELPTFDLSPIELRNFDDEDADVRLRFREPVRVTPTVDESGHLILLDYAPLYIQTHGETREELEDAVHGLVWAQWDTFTKMPEDKLSADGRDFRDRLLEALEEVPLVVAPESPE